MLTLALLLQAATTTVERSIEHGGEVRRWSELVPAACAKSGTRCPLVVVLHGGNPLRGSARTNRGAGALAERVGMAEAASRDGFVMLAPASVAGNWNDGRPGIASEYDDVGFIRAMVGSVATRTGVDRRRIFAVGVSNGGLMSFRLACDASDMFRAVAPIVAQMGRTLAERCAPKHAVDIVQILGMKDRLMRYDGGVVAQARGGIMSAAESLAFWRAKLGGSAPVESRPQDGVVLRSITSPKGRFAQYSLETYGHGWPGADAEVGGGRMPGIRGVAPVGFSSTATVITFLKATKPR